MWKISKNFLLKDAEGYLRSDGVKYEEIEVTSGDFYPEFWEDAEKFDFRLYDGDGNLYYEGQCTSCDDDEAFEPLDDYGDPNDGCTEIKYKDPETREWETL